MLWNKSKNFTDILPNNFQEDYGKAFKKYEIEDEFMTIILQTWLLKFVTSSMNVKILRALYERPFWNYD